LKPDIPAFEHRPEFEWRFLAPGFWPTWLWLGLVRMLGWLPARLRGWLGDRLGELVYRLHGKRRHIVQVNLRLCFPALSAAQREALARRYYRLLARSLLDYHLIWWGSARRVESQIELEGEEHLARCKAEGRPVILLTCHMVGLDFGALVISRRYPGVGLIKPARNPLVEWLLTRGRTRYLARLFKRDTGIRPIVRTLRQGFLFYYLPDEDLGGRKPTVFAPFFGVPTATLTALGRLAGMTGAAVLPGATYYDAATGRYRMRISPPLEDFPTGDEIADATRMNREIEALVREAPDQYMWSFRLFQTRPEGERSPYENLSEEDT